MQNINNDEIVNNYVNRFLPSSSFLGGDPRKKAGSEISGESNLKDEKLLS